MTKIDKKSKYALAILSLTSAGLGSTEVSAGESINIENSFSTNVNSIVSSMKRADELGGFADNPNALANTLGSVHAMAARDAFKSLRLEDGRIFFPSAKEAVLANKKNIDQVLQFSDERSLNIFLDALTNQVESTLLEQHTCRMNGSE
jgi:hypothetical protein